MDKICEVYILNRYTQGEYILSDIPFSTTRQNNDDIFIKKTHFWCLTNEDDSIRFWFPLTNIEVDSIKDISKVLKVTYNEHDILKSIEVLIDGVTYPYIYKNMMHNELEEKIKCCIKLCSDEVICKIKNRYTNHKIARIFIDAYWDSGNDMIDIYVADKKSFNIDSTNRHDFDIDEFECYKETLQIHIDNTQLKALTYYMQSFDVVLKNNFIDIFINDLQENILKEVSKFATFTNDFKYIYRIID